MSENNGHQSRWLKIVDQQTNHFDKRFDDLASVLIRVDDTLNSLKGSIDSHTNSIKAHQQATERIVEVLKSSIPMRIVIILLAIIATFFGGVSLGGQVLKTNLPIIAKDVSNN